MNKIPERIWMMLQDCKLFVVSKVNHQEQSVELVDKTSNGVYKVSWKRIER